MKLQHLKFAVVVVAQNHNPTILHPSFLTSEQIVPEDWELAGPPICTPAFSLAQYSNGVTFHVESNRLVVTDHESDRSPEDSPVPGIVTKYIDKLPHVRYQAVGLNFHGFVACDNPDVFVIHRFLKEGPWNDAAHPMTSFGARFVYTAEEALLYLSCDAGSIQHDDKQQRVILVNGNYHSELPVQDSIEHVEHLIGRYSERYRHFVGFASEILGLED